MTEAQAEIPENESNEKPTVEEVAEQFNSEQTQLKEAEEKIAELNDKLLRTAAEAQNVKRRAQIDIENAGKYSIEKFARDMISVLDNLFRAEESISKGEENESEHIKSIKEGVDLTKNEMISAFRRHGIERVMPVDQPFDHNLHQAMAQVPTADKEPETVIDVMQAGYTIKGRLLRPALVAVAKAVEEAPKAEEAEPKAQPNTPQSLNDMPKTEEF